MSKYRNNLPILSDDIYLTDGGLETSIIFKEGIDLPEFAAFTLLTNDIGIKKLENYYEKYIAIAKKNNLGFILESPTWRASSKWGEILSYSNDDLIKINENAITLLEKLRNKFETKKTKIVISACIGPKGDGYVVGDMMSVEDALFYHFPQIKTFSSTKADLVTAFTLSYSNEAIGMVKAAQNCNMPIVIGFTVGTNGNLPSGQSLKEAITEVDKHTQNHVKYFMINCAHPSHFKEVLNTDGEWKKRIRAVRANASKKSHTELDNSTKIDDGNLEELSQDYVFLRKQLLNLNILGGCCGTDERHIEAICNKII